jgi:hypothetical protein
MSLDRYIEAARRAKESRETAERAFKALPADKRYEFVLAAASQLPLDQMQQLVGELAVQIEPERATPGRAEHRAEKPVVSDEPDDPGGKYVDKAETYVLDHPEGVDTADVAKAIGQKVENVDGTLRQVMNTRKTIERRDGKWCPKSVAPSAPVTGGRKTIRKTIFEALATAKKPLDSADIWQGAKEIDPDLVRGSFENEMNRLRKEKLIVIVPGKVGKHGSGVYTLANGGAHAAP